MEIDFNHIDSIPQLVKDFLGGKLDFATTKVFNTDHIARQIEEKAKSYSSEVRKDLHESLSVQLSKYDLSAVQLKNLDLLKQDNTFTVTTGHQLNLFTGPVFFIYKILQTIKTAEFLKETFPTKNFVPIFWMATEDHDFDEINHFKTENQYYQTFAKEGEAVGRIKIADLDFIAAFEKEVKDCIYGTELILMLKNAYQIGRTFAEATTIIGQYLFRNYGLLMLDGDDKRLKTLMKSIFRQELLDEKLYQTTTERRVFLEKHYHKVQVNPREINLFYFSPNRNRIERRDDQFFILDTDLVFTKDEILRELDDNPENFSPNAVLRSAYQETILPNIAYIGGNAEIMYWLELDEYFKSINLPFPILVPRNSLLFLNEKTVRKIEKLNLSEVDFFKDYNLVIKNHLLEKQPLQPLLQVQEEALKTQFSTLKNEASLTDVTFKNLVEAEETRQLKSFKRMQKRLLRAEKIKQSEEVIQLENIFVDVHPAGVWQERQFNFSVFYADYGKDWIATCYDLINVEKSELLVSHLI